MQRSSGDDDGAATDSERIKGRAALNVVNATARPAIKSLAGSFGPAYGWLCFLLRVASFSGGAGRFLLKEPMSDSFEQGLREFTAQHNGQFWLSFFDCAQALELVFKHDEESACLLNAIDTILDQVGNSPHGQPCLTCEACITVEPDPRALGKVAILHGVHSGSIAIGFLVCVNCVARGPVEMQTRALDCLRTVWPDLNAKWVSNPATETMQ